MFGIDVLGNEPVVDLLYFGTKLHGLLVYSILKIMVQLHWFYSELDDQQVTPPT